MSIFGLPAWFISYCEKKIRRITGNGGFYVEVLVYGLVSLVLLVPILYVLPLNMTGKGKVVIALTAAVFAVGADYASDIVPMWQNGLLMVAVAGGTSLIFGKKLGTFLFIAEEGMSVMDSFQDKLESDGHVLEENSMEPIVAVLVPNLNMGKETAEPFQEGIQDTELLNHLGAEDIEEVHFIENVEQSVSILESGSLEPIYTAAADTKKETGFLDELDMFQDIEELLEKSVPASPFAGGADSPFEERDLEILIQSDDEELPVLDFSKKESNQVHEHDDYITALLETAASVEEEKAGGSGNV